MLTKKELYNVLNIFWSDTLQDEEIAGVSTDSRDIKPQMLFIALEGEQFDGHNFIQQALDRGAILAITHKQTIYDDRVIMVQDTLQAYQRIAAAYRGKFDIPVIAVTGSTGKTTTKDIIASALSGSLKVLKNHANFNNEIGVPKTLLQLDDTYQAAIVEMGMRGLGQIKELADIAKPDIAVITTVNNTHIELLGSIDNIALAKAEVLADFDANNVAILNYDNEYTRNMQTKARKVYFGLQPEADISAENIQYIADTTSFICVDKLKNTTYKVTIPLVGLHNVQNALAAIAVVNVLGLPLSPSLAALEKLTISAMRQSVACYLPGVTVINDAYNASPASMKAALSTMTNFVATRRIAVLGDMLELGADSEAMHYDIGKSCKEYNVDVVLTFGEYARFIGESASKENILAKHFTDKETLAVYLKQLLQKDDIILVKGSRGMKMETIIPLVFK